MADVKIDGLDELFEKFKQLEQVAGTKAARRAITKAAAEMRKTARKNIKALDDPNTPESIYKNITSVRWKSNKNRKYVGASVGVRKDGPGSDTFYWRFLELGTKKIEARNTISDSLTESAPAAMSAFTAEATKIISEL